MAPQVKEEVDKINKLLPPTLQLSEELSRVELWAVIFRLHSDWIAGPEPHSTWKEAAVNERLLRVRGKT